MSSDRIKKHLDAYIMRLVNPVDWYAPYACKVVKQSADGSVDLRPEDKRLDGYQTVPIHYGVPGTSATFQPGARVMMEFENGDRTKPFVSSFDFATITALSFGSGAGALATDTLVIVELGKIATVLNAIVSGSYTPPTSVGTTVVKAQ